MCICKQTVTPTNKNEGHQQRCNHVTLSHRCTRFHMCVYIYMYICIHTYVDIICVFACKHAGMLAITHACMYVSRIAQVYVCSHTYTRARTHTHSKCIHPTTHKQVKNGILLHICAQTQTQTHVHDEMHAYVHAQLQNKTLTNMYAC